MTKSWSEYMDLAGVHLEKAQRHMKKWADARRRQQEYYIGDEVIIKLLPHQFKPFRGVHKGLLRKYEEHFNIIARVEKVSYRLDLPNTLNIHPVFHVSMLKPYYPDEEDTSRGDSHRTPLVATTYFDKDVEEVLAKRIERRRGVQPSTQYLIKWNGFPESEATWKTRDMLSQFKELLQQFEATRVSAEYVGENVTTGTVTSRNRA
ncbi:uncharacterized protein [Henckelia pumila]|uniref:uncharacterized protein n=1 Tax=Henckelia pumila TaxID=405737 RepID=UPI003C6E045D